MRFYTTDQLSPNRHLTPEGFLLCKDVAIARTGEQIYAPGEIAAVPGDDGFIHVQRTPEAVFHDDTIASFQGKPITLDHPIADVNPRNWGALAKGVVQHVRRGAGASEGLLLADLLITADDAIHAVRENGLREVSCGYDADYIQTSPGQAFQRNIIGNHVALVSKGRCGERCAIGDKAMSKTSFFDKLKAAFKDRDETRFESILKDHRVRDEEEETEEEREKRKKKEAEEKTEDSLKRILGDALSPLVARLDKLEKPVAKEEPIVIKTDDSAALVAEVQDTFARAEIVAPGVSLPTVDAKGDAQRTRDSLCALRRKALEMSFHGKGRDAITPFLGEKPDFSAITCDAAKSALLGASEILKRENKGEVRFRDSKDARTEFQKQMDVTRDINARNAKFWNRPVN